MQYYRDVVTDPYGNAVEKAEVAVLDVQGNLATLYADNGAAPAALLNPLTTDANGGFAFYAVNGRYSFRVTGTGLPTREVPDVIVQDTAQLVTAADVLNDYVASGLLPAVPAPVSLSATTPAGVVYILGTRAAPAATAKAYTASQDTYVDLSSLGAYTYSAVANGAAVPAIAANSVRLFKVVTNATEITGVTDLRNTGLILKSSDGQYTPTLTAVANVDTTTAYVAQHFRIGNMVTVFGRFDVDPTVVTTLTRIGLSLPVASNLSSIEQCAGTLYANEQGWGGVIYGDITNDRAELRFIPGAATNHGLTFHFSYRVI